MRYFAGGSRLKTAYQGTGKWCKELWARNAFLQFTSGKAMNWKDIFTSRKAHLTAWASKMAIAYAVGSVMNFEDGDTLDIPNDAVDQSELVGTVNQRGGDIVPAGLFFVNSQNGSRYNLMGGTFKIRQYCMFLTSNSSTSNVAFVQSGGTGYVNSAIDVGGNGGNERSIADFALSGGTMSASQVALCSTRMSTIAAISDSDPTIGSCAGVYTQTDGTLAAKSIAIGNAANLWNTDYAKIVDGFALFRLMGGEVAIQTADGGIQCLRSWNDNGKVTGDDAGRYRLAFSGGIYRDAYDRAVGMQFDVPAGEEGPFTYDAGLGTHTLNAPIWGEGTLRKVGMGKLVLNDATRFTGALKVDEGAVEFAGNGTLKPYDFASDGAIVWSGDDVATGKADGAEIFAWSDTTKTYTATNVPALDSYFENVCLNPKVVLNSFNGHAGVKFYVSGNNATGLMAPKVLNPLNGCTNFTVAIVLKTKSSGGIENSSADYKNAYNMGIFGSHIHYGNNNFGFALDNAGKASFCRSGGGLGNATAFTSAVTPDKVNDGAVQVLVGTSEGCRLEQTLNHLGYETSRANAKATSGLPYRIGYDSTTSYDTVYEPLCFGFHARHVTHYDTDKNPPQMRCAFQGELAEIRVYPERLMTEKERNALAAALKLKFDGTATEESVTRHMSGGVPMTGDAPAYAEAARVALPTGAVEWDAADVVAEDGAAVATWAGRTGKSATQALGKGEAAPTYVKNAIAGRPALRFNAAAKSALGLAAADSPLSAATAFTMAVVFKTRTDGVGNGDMRRGRGLLSTVQGTADAEDVLLALQSEGSVYVANGKGASANIFTRKPCRLNDGCVHVAVYSADMANKVLMLMTDGRKTLRKVTSLASPLPSRDLTVGCVGNGTDGEYFDGDIAAFAVWPRALTAAEMTTVTEHYAHEFRFRPLAKGTFAAGSTSDRGLGATNITVAAGAYFRTPLSEATPFVVSAGLTLSGEGHFDGTYSFGEGTTLGASIGVNMEQAILNGSAIEVDYADVLANGPKDLSCVTKATGAVSVRIVNLPTSRREIARRVPLFRLSPSAIGDGVTFTLTGEGIEPPMQRLEIAADGLFTLLSERGSAIIVR